jgi:hypothetical protein
LRAAAEACELLHPLNENPCASLRGDKFVLRLFGGGLRAMPGTNPAIRRRNHQLKNLLSL